MAVKPQKNKVAEAMEALIKFGLDVDQFEALHKAIWNHIKYLDRQATVNFRPGMQVQWTSKKYGGIRVTGNITTINQDTCSVRADQAVGRYPAGALWQIAFRYLSEVK